MFCIDCFGKSYQTNSFHPAFMASAMDMAYGARKKAKKEKENNRRMLSAPHISYNQQLHADKVLNTFYLVQNAPAAKDIKRDFRKLYLQKNIPYLAENPNKCSKTLLSSIDNSFHKPKKVYIYFNQVAFPSFFSYSLNLQFHRQPFL